MPGKKRLSPQQSQEYKSKAQIMEVIVSAGHVVSEVTPDLGEDLNVRLFDDGEITGLSFNIQLKSTKDIDSLKHKNKTIKYVFETKDLDYWYSQSITIFLVIWDVKQNAGWWIWINDAIKNLEVNNSSWRDKNSVTIYFPLENKLDNNGLTTIRHILANHYYPILSKDKELQINMKFSFPQTEEGIKKFQELNNHFLKGDAVEIDGQYITKFEFPEWWDRMFGRIDPSKLHLSISVQKSKLRFPCSIVFQSSKIREVIHHIELWSVKQGAEEVTLATNSPKFPIKITLVANRKTKYLSLTFNFNFSNFDCSSILQELYIQDILSSNGKVIFTFLDTGETITIPAEKKEFSAPDKSLIMFIENCVKIQTVFGVTLFLPDDSSITIGDHEAAKELISIIESGTYTQKNLNFSIDLLKHELISIYNNYKHHSKFLLQIKSSESFVEILGKKFDLGPIIQQIRGDTDIAIEDIEKWLSSADEDDVFKLVLVNVELFESFENWIKK